MTPRLNAVDMSRWGGELTADEARALRDAGVRLVIVGTGNAAGAGQWARQQAQAALGAGMAVDAYIYLYFAGDPRNQVRDALDTLAGLQIRRWWLDAEDVESEELTVAQRHAFLSAAVAEVERVMLVSPGIYTGGWWWKTRMANSGVFSLLPLWNSWYDGDPDIDGLPYGGWTADDVAIEQYQGTTVLCGQSVDLNWARDIEGDDVVTRAEFDALLARVEALELADFAGSEQRGADGKTEERAARLDAARGRIDERAAGTAQSLLEVASTRALVVPAHQHELNLAIAQTGPVKR